MSTHDTYLLNILPEKLKTDPTYQRMVSQSRVKKIVDNFNMDLFNPPKVSHRADGYYYIFDGQHSVVSHKTQFGDNTPILCKVYEGLTYEEEIELFVQQNGVSQDVSTRDKLKAQYNDPNSDVRKMVEAAKKAGITIDFKAGQYRNHICAVGAAYSIWQMLGKDDFINVLSVIKDTWDGEPISFHAGILKGLAFIYKKYGSKVQNAKVITALRKHTPDYYIREAEDMKGSLTMRFAKIIVDTYNYKKFTNRLEEI